jgi:hypothetical protein
MSDLDTKERLARLRECFPTDAVLADKLSCDEKTVTACAGGAKDLSTLPDVQTKIDRLHEQIQKEHAAGLDAVSYALQTIERLKQGTITDEKLDNVQEVLQQKADDLNNAYA